MLDDYVEKDRKKATELGYSKLSDLVEDVMKLKINKRYLMMIIEF